LTEKRLTEHIHSSFAIFQYEFLFQSFLYLIFELGITLLVVDATLMELQRLFVDDFEQIAGFSDIGLSLRD